MSYPLPLGRTLTRDDVSIAWELRGAEGDPVLVLCHGFSGSAADFDQHTEALVDEGFRVLTLDHRGHGRSGRSQTYTFAALAADLAHLIATEVDGPVHLLGHSMGGRVALEVVLTHPQLVSSLILMDTSAWSFISDPTTLAGYEAMFEAFDPAKGLPTDVGAGPDEPLMQRVSDPAFLKGRSDVQKLFDPVAFKLLGQALFGSTASVRDRLPELDLPVTVIAGEFDEPFVSQAAELAALTNGRAEIIAGGYHSPQITHQSEWRSAVLAHLASAV